MIKRNRRKIRKRVVKNNHLSKAFSLIRIRTLNLKI